MMWNHDVKFRKFILKTFYVGCVFSLIHSDSSSVSPAHMKCLQHTFIADTTPIDHDDGRDWKYSIV